MSSSDTTFDMLNQIQYNIMAMNVEQQISLLDECLNSISKIKSEQPKLMEMINNTFRGSSCLLTKESLNLFREFISIYNIGSGDFLIENAQKGGIGDEDNQIVESGTPVSLYNQPQQQPSQLQQQVNQPVNIVAALAQNVCNLGGLSAESQALYMNALITAVEGQVKDQAVITKAQAGVINAQAANENYFRRSNFTGTIFSFMAPGALMYYFQSVMDKVAVGTLYAAGNVAADTVGGVELGIRNAIPFAIENIRSVGFKAKNYIPTSVYNLMKTTSDIVPSQIS